MMLIEVLKKLGTGKISAIEAGDAAAPPSKGFVGKHWSDLGKFDQIWEKLRQNLGKSD